LGLRVQHGWVLRDPVMIVGAPRFGFTEFWDVPNVENDFGGKLHDDVVVHELENDEVAVGGESQNGDQTIELCSKELLSDVEGFLLDLDGTLYSPAGLLDGAQAFFTWIEKSNKPYVLLSNGFKTSEGVASKFASKKFLIDQKVEPSKVHTAGLAVANYLGDHAPPKSKLYAIGTGVQYGDGTKDSLMRILKRTVEPELFDTWEVRTDLSMDEIFAWGAKAKENEPVFVVMAFMGCPNDTFSDDPVTGKKGYNTLDYDLMKKITILLRNGSRFVVGAPDVADSQPVNPAFPDVDPAWPTMGGTENFFLASAEMFPGTERRERMYANVGKGGNKGAEYMMQPGIDMLMKQNPHINKKKIMMIGDNFGTDIKAANEVGVQSALVLVGAHSLEDASNWPTTPTCYLPNIGSIPDIIGN